jgi:predicted GIY-YIG superfamily endonuclease
MGAALRSYEVVQSDEHRHVLGLHFSPAGQTERFTSASPIPCGQGFEQHRCGRGSEFVKKHGVHLLVYVEAFASPQETIAGEQQLKNWRRDWKIQLIEKENPGWSDLSHLL